MLNQGKIQALHQEDNIAIEIKSQGRERKTDAEESHCGRYDCDNHDERYGMPKAPKGFRYGLIIRL